MGKEAEEDRNRIEWLKCVESFAYFADTYCKIYDATVGAWIPFHLWPDQVAVAQDLKNFRLNIILKARQLGMTWLVLCYVLWRSLFFPAFTALLFSRRETEAIVLLGKARLRGIYDRLPGYMQVKRVQIDSTHIWELSNGSIVYAFPTTAGDSYTASFAMVDEADLVPDLDKLMGAVKPTIDGGGRMCLLSRVDKDTPNSEFKRIYLGAKAGKNSWNHIFLPWYSRPERSKEWYKEQHDDILWRTGALDELYQQYPATDAEALQSRSLNKRFPAKWLKQCYVPKEPLEEDEVDIYIPGLRAYAVPKYGEEFVISADPAEGNPTSDDSAVHVLNMETGEECAVLNDKIEPAILAEYIDMLAVFYNDAAILVERNNHGHAVILALKDTHDQIMMAGPDDRDGWATSGKSKAQMYTYTADALRDRQAVIHDLETYTQLTSIGGSDLSAPEGDRDDMAVSFGLGCSAIQLGGARAEYGIDPTLGYRG